MKKWKLILLIFCSSCVNPRSAPEDVDEQNVVNSQDVIKKYEPKVSKKEMAISQNDIIMNEAVAISNDFYNNLINQNYGGANKYMSPDALSVTSISQWIEIYKKAQDKKGRLASVNMYDYGVKCKMLGGNGMGDYAELIFDTQYKDGNFREKLTFYRKDSTESVKILGYEYDEKIDRVKIYKGLR